MKKSMDTLTQFCKDNDIHNGQISGIGAIKNIEMGAYDIEKKDISFIKSRKSGS